jgi:hypothetical protein
VTAIARHLVVGRSTLYRGLDLERAAAAGQATGDVPVTAPRVREPDLAVSSPVRVCGLMPTPMTAATFRIGMIMERA